MREGGKETGSKKGVEGREGEEYRGRKGGKEKETEKGKRNERGARMKGWKEEGKSFLSSTINPHHFLGAGCEGCNLLLTWHVIKSMELPTSHQ